MVNTPEIRMDCSDDKKFNVVKTLVEEFKTEYDVIDVDGARVLFDGGWGRVRGPRTPSLCSCSGLKRPMKNVLKR